MKLLSISTSGYRNLAGETLELSDGINLLYGNNAAGKTNTLEGAYVFASGRCFKARQESEVIKVGESTAKADIVIDRDGYREDMTAIWHNSREKGYIKRLLYRGSEVSKVSEFLGIFRAVLFTPDHLNLIKGGPEERRKLMDVALSQMSPKYVYCMNCYNKILSQKNAYLKRLCAGEKCDDEYLGTINEQLAKAAAVIIKQRSGFADLLKSFASVIYSKISDSKEALDIKYISATKRDFSDTEYTEKRLFEIFSLDKESEIRGARVIHGPHKDDLMIYINRGKVNESAENGYKIGELAARTFGSQGQQRSAVLALKLAEGEICNNITGEYPVFLFDDLLGELDTKRRRKLMELIKDRQVLITCCDREAMPDLAKVSAVKVENGRYIRE